MFSVGARQPATPRELVGSGVSRVACGFCGGGGGKAGGGRRPSVRRSHREALVLAGPSALAVLAGADVGPPLPPPPIPV